MAELDEHGLDRGGLGRAVAHVEARRVMQARGARLFTVDGWIEAQRDDLGEEKLIAQLGECRRLGDVLGVDHRMHVPRSAEVRTSMLFVRARNASPRRLDSASIRARTSAVSFGGSETTAQRRMFFGSGTVNARSMLRRGQLSPRRWCPRLFQPRSFPQYAVPPASVAT